MTQNRARELEARALARLATDGSLAGWREAAGLQTTEVHARAPRGGFSSGRKARDLEPAAAGVDPQLIGRPARRRRARR